MTRRVGVLVVVALTVSLGVLAAGAVPVVADTVRVSVASDGTQANAGSSYASVSTDGSTIAFHSDASNLVAGDTNNNTDVFMFDVASATTTRVSVSSDGTQANAASFWPAVSADGSTIAYQSSASNLVAGDTNGNTDVFMFDVASGTTTRVSAATDGTQTNAGSDGPSVSADGSTIAYRSSASNLAADDTNGVADVFVFDVVSGTTTRVSAATDGTQANAGSDGPSVSGDGSTIVYQSLASNLVEGDTNGNTDVFMFDVASGTTTRVSVATDGTQTNAGSDGPSVSGDGSTIVYQSSASNLVEGDTNGTRDVFMFDVASGTTTRVSVASDGSQTNANSSGPAVSADGSKISYSSWAANLVAGDTNNTQDVFVFDGVSGTTTRVSVATDGTPSNSERSSGSSGSAVSADGSTIAYHSFSSKLVAGDTNNEADVFMTTLGGADVPGDAFTDDNGSVFEADIEWLASSGITRGCNPPDNTLFCPDEPVTRGQMAAFLVRALGYTDAGGGDLFDDDNASVFEADIDKLATVGVTRGCNPPDNTLFCPDEPVTRGQMAAFLVRALGYTDAGGGDLFDDDNASVFEADIDKLATVGVTRGCNPPDNTLFCPDEPVTRGQMAGFLHRALG